jgi:AAA15 family ATPase/GTPase
VSKVSIKNFKSIKHLEFNSKKFNIFIGEPNTGKSNILEAIGLFSIKYLSKTELKHKLKLLIRFDSAINLFYDNQTSLEIEVKIGNFNLKVKAVENDNISIDLNSSSYCVLDAYGNVKDLKQEDINEKMSIKFYRFRKLYKFPKKTFSFLLPPDGENLLTILSTNNKIHNLVNNLLEEKGLKIALDEGESKIKILKLNSSKTILYPYSILSDTFQRMIFYLTAIKSNKNSILVFEEPETHTFPYYTKYLAEVIALDDLNNQYFISTHNIYFLNSLLEKANKDDLAVFIVYYKNYETKIRELSYEEKMRILEEGKDVFFNIEQFIEE